MNRPLAFSALAVLTLLLANPVAAPAADSAMAAPDSQAIKEVVRLEVVAFNAHDAEAVTKAHATTAQIAVLPSSKVLANGEDQIRTFFVKLFKSSPNVHITLEKQFVHDGVVVNHYGVTGGSTSEGISIYDVRHGVIANEWLIF